MAKTVSKSSKTMKKTADVGDLFGGSAKAAKASKESTSAERAARARAASSAGEAGYTAKHIEVLEGLEPVRRRPGMYIGGTDEKALHHLFAEVIDNSMDEALAGHATFIEVHLGADGYLTVSGRLKELIIRGGQNIAPAEVEDAVLSHPDVLDCAVIGVPHPQLGEVPVACVVKRPGHELSEAAIKAHCSTQISAYKVPAQIHEVAAIPRTGSGKIMRFKLRESLPSTP